MDNVDILWYSNTTSDSCNDGNTILSNYFYNTIRIRIHILCGMEGNMIGHFQWINGYEDKHSNPVYRHAKNPDKWEIKSNRLIVSYYGDGGAIDIRLMDTDKDLQHQINITIDDGKLKAIISEQTK